MSTNARNLQADSPPGISAAPQGDNLMCWEAIIFGPENTTWEGGIFRLILQFSEEYPSKAPHVEFKSKVFHPNVYLDGKICLDILNKQWSQLYDVAAVLTSIQSLLCDPNPTSPANQTAAKMFEDDPVNYKRKVKETVRQSWEYKTTYG